MEGAATDGEGAFANEVLGTRRLQRAYAGACPFVAPGTAIADALSISTLQHHARVPRHR